MNTLTLTTYEKCEAEAFANTPPGFVIDANFRVSIRIQSSLNYAISRELEETGTLEPADLMLGTRNAMRGMLRNLYQGAIDNGQTPEAMEKVIRGLVESLSNDIEAFLSGDQGLMKMVQVGKTVEGGGGHA